LAFSCGNACDKVYLRLAPSQHMLLADLFLLDPVHLGRTCTYLYNWRITHVASNSDFAPLTGSRRPYT